MTEAGLSLRIKLIIAFAAMALIPLLCANLLTLQRTEQTIRKIVFERNRDVAKNIASDIDDMFAEKIRLMKIAADNTDIRSMDPGRMVPALSHIPANHPELLLAIVLAPNGDLLARSDGKPQDKANYSDREYFRTATRTGQVTISDVLVSKTTGKLDIGIAEPIKNADMTPRGMLVIGVSLHKIIDRIAGTRIGTAGYAYVISKTGKVLIPAGQGMSHDSEDISGLPPIKAAIDGQTGWMEYELHGRKMLAGYSYVPTTGWGLIVEQPLADAMAAATRLRITTILIMVVTVLVAVVVAFALAGTIFKPVALLTNAAKRVAAGDLETQANFESSDEIGILAAAFNHMTKQLKAREEALHQSQEQYRRIVDTSTEGVAVMDEDQRFTFVNAHMAKMLGYDAKELIGREFESILFDEDMPDHRNQMKNRRLEMASQYERRLKHRDGHAVWTNISATPIFDAHHHFEGSFGMITDITERKKAENLLRESNEKFALAFNNAPINIAISSLDNGLYLDVNQQFLDTFGFSRDEVVGKSSLELGLITNVQREQVIEVIRKKGAVEELELVMSAKSGKELLFKYWGKTIIVSNQERLLSLFLDITEHRKIEQQFQQAQKMDSVGRLAGGVAHDFNNMLGVILGHAEMAMIQVDPIQPLYANLEEISKAAYRSADLTRQLLAFARKQTIAPKVIDVNETIEGFLKMLRRLIGEDIDLAWMPGAGLWPVKADPSQMDQILANLCVNARDSILGVGKIIIETSNGICDEEFCSIHSGCISGDYVKISVSDTGSGMDRLTLAHIFEPFFTTKVVGAGTGLGLSTVYGAVKQNNGFIDVYSEPGQGTIFTIYLPRYKEVSVTTQTSIEKTAEAAVGGHETILLVEDESAILEMTARMLQSFGYDVITAGNPGEAVRLVKEFKAEIHLLMTDVIMPEMNGRDLADRLMTLKRR